MMDPGSFLVSPTPAPARVSFWVSGVPATKGSARAFGAVDKATGRVRAWTRNDASEKARPWSAAVSAAAQLAMGERAPLDEPLRVSLSFRLARPKKHYRAGGQLRADAPAFASSTPDVDKLARCLLDALIGIVVRDDARIAVLVAEKRYSDDGRLGAEIVVEPLGGVR